MFHPPWDSGEYST